MSLLFGLRQKVSVGLYVDQNHHRRLRPIEYYTDFTNFTNAALPSGVHL